MRCATIADAPSFSNLNDKALWVLGFNTALTLAGTGMAYATRREPVDLKGVGGQALGKGYPDWPKDLQTYAERAAYQRGVAHARAVDRG